MIPGQSQQFFEAAAAQAAGGGGGFEIERSLRFNEGDSPSLTRTVSSASNQKKWTWSGWFKRGSASQPGRFFSAGPSATNRTNIFLYPRSSSLGIGFYSYVGGVLVGQAGSVPVLADHSAWYHLVFAFDAANSIAADRLKIYINGVEQSVSYVVNVSNIDHYVNNNTAHYVGRGADGYSFDGYLAEINFVDGQALAPTDFGQTDSDNNWNPKEFSGTYGTNGFYLKFADNSSAAALGTDSSGNNNDWTVNNLSVAAGPLSSSRGTNYDDDSATYTEYGTVSQATGQTLPMSNPSHYEGAAMRVNTGGFKVVTTNSATTDFFMACWVKFDSLANGYQMGVDLQGSYKYFEARSGGAVLVRHIGGAATSSSTGILSTNTWIHIALSRSGGTLRAFVNGTIACSTTAGVTGDSISANEEFNFFGQSGTFYNIPGYLLDPVVYIGAGRSTNYTTPTAPLLTSAGAINDVAGMSSSNRYYASPLISVGPGAEAIDSLIDTPTNYEADSGNNGGNYATLNPLSKGGQITLSNGNLDWVASSTTPAWETRYSFSTIGVTSGKWYAEATITDIGNNQVYVGVVGDPEAPYSNTSLGYQAHGWGYYSQGNIFWQGGQYQAAATFTTGDTIGVALDLDNLTIKFYKNGTLEGTRTGLTSGKTYLFGANSYSNCAQSWNFGQRPFAHTPPTGHLALVTTNLSDPTIADGSTAMDVTLYTGTRANQVLTFGMQPDFVWAKNRSQNLYNHVLTDSVRGASKVIFSNLTNAEQTSNSIIDWDYGTNQVQLGDYGQSSETGDSYVAWAWDAGTSTVTNTDGSLTSTVRANPSAGFSIVNVSSDGTDTIRTAGHGLNAVPYFIISKNRDFVDNWFVYHKDIQTDNKQRLNLNTTGAVNSSGSLIWAHTSSVIGFNGAQYVGLGTDDLIFYCFAPVEGFSAFGSYTGNGSTDGPFVFTGFKVRWLMYKRTDAANSWQILDTERDPANVNNLVLIADLANAESTGTGNNDQFDMLSNGFKVRSSNFAGNASGGTYIYAAFAEHPFKTARAR